MKGLKILEKDIEYKMNTWYNCEKTYISLDDFGQISEAVDIMFDSDAHTIYEAEFKGKFISKNKYEYTKFKLIRELNDNDINDHLCDKLEKLFI